MKKSNSAVPARDKTKQLVQKTVLIAVFSALAFGVSVAVHFPVSFLTLDFKDAILAVGGMFCGPVAALLMSGIAALLEFLTISDTGVYGLIMNFLASAAFSVTAAVIYKYRKSFSGAITALVASVFSMTAVMMIANLTVTPFYMGVPVGQVLSMIPTLLLPFNLIKASLNAALTALLYKPLSAGLSRIFPQAHPLTRGKFDKRSFILVLAAVAVIVVALVLLFVYFDAKIAFGKA